MTYIEEPLETQKKYIGVDYGTKRIGLAISSPDGSMAFPLSVIENRRSEDSAQEIWRICQEKGEITDVVLGESKNFKGEDNVVMGEVRKFSELLRAKGLTVIFEPEIMSTIQAERIQGQKANIDASAAAIILQSYLERMKKESKKAEQEMGGIIETLEDIEDRKYSENTRPGHEE